jgi:hypothetical protein
MAASVDQAARLARVTRRPLWLSILAAFSLLLGTFTPQFYYVLLGLGWVPIGPNTNPLGEVWYWFILNGDNVY